MMLKELSQYLNNDRWRHISRFGGALSQRGAYDEAAEEDTEPPLHCQAVDDVMIWTQI